MDRETLYEYLKTKQDVVEFLIEKSVSKDSIETSKQDFIQDIGDLNLYHDIHEKIRRVSTY